MERTKRFSYSPKWNSAVEILLRCYSLHQTMYRPAKSVDWCQCCMQEVAFIYLSPFLRPRPPCLKGAVTEGDWGVVVLSLRHFVTPPSSEGGFKAAYNHFTNYAVRICKRGRFIPADLLSMRNMI